ncbi:cadherin-related family member 5 [Trichomycterus rosablanca]|uniref:cadherin-related family member 5 n=1 Tax=Trichomycterus rosablanca TaxID=2290929 RepID=UPI002F357CB9
MGQFIANINISGDPAINHIDLRLDGTDADWLFLDGKTIRLNSSDTRVLDREVHGAVLTAKVKCYEDGTLQSEHRITVEILNQNDNRPEFLQSTIQLVQISELTAVNSVAFTVQATDADGETLVYGIDETSPDASYFRVDHPNTGQIILNRSLNYETKTQLKLQLYAVEMDTTEHYSTTATLTINVIDADDQYPQFQPCILLPHSQSSHICVNPLYTVNITENDVDMILDFSPGPIQAVDGDEGLRTPLTYTILSGADNGRFVINTESGEVRLTRRVENRLLMPTLRLRIMAAQRDDPMKYSVATALVRVLAENVFQPQFSRSTYHGFVTESSSPASIAITYGMKLLILEATDQDFIDGINPNLWYSLSPNSNSSELYYVTQDGLLIAKANQLQPNHNHTLEVLATDQESGDVVKAVIYINVLEEGEPVPQGPLDERQDHGSRTWVVEGVSVMCLVLLAITTIVLVCFVKKRRVRQDPAERADIAENKHPNVTLRRFQYLVNQSEPLPLVEEVSYYNEAFGGYDASTFALHGKQGFYTHRDQDASNKSQSSKTSLPLNTMSLQAIDCASQCLESNRRPILASIPIHEQISLVKNTENTDVEDAQLVKLDYTEKMIPEKKIGITELETSNTDLDRANQNQGTENAYLEKFLGKANSDQINTEIDQSPLMKTSGTSFTKQHRCQNEQEAKQEIGRRMYELKMQMHNQPHKQR